MVCLCHPGGGELCHHLCPICAVLLYALCSTYMLYSTRRLLVHVYAGAPVNRLMASLYCRVRHCTVRAVPYVSRRSRTHNEFTAIIERDVGWYVTYCPDRPGANGL